MNFVVIDLETTGFHGPEKGGRIIEIGAVKVENFKIVDRFSTFINPEMKIPKKITEITNITDDMVSSSPTIWQVIHKLWDFIDGYTLVAHNSKFDWDRFLKFYFNKIGKHATNDVICTAEKSKEIFISKELYANKQTNRINHKLIDLCERLDVKLNNAHRAINDCEALTECFIKMYYKYPEHFVKERDYRGVTLDNKYNNKVDFIIYSVNYWESVIDKGKKTERIMRRFYIKLSPKYIQDINKCCPGTVFFDIDKKCWANKDFLYNIDYNLVEKMVLEKMEKESLKELYYSMRANYLDRKRKNFENK